MRAIALMSFAGISRHPEQGTDCRLCEAGASAYCPGCFVDAVVDYRKTLREQAGYTDIRWTRDIDRNAGTARIALEQLAELQQAARRGGWEG